MQQGSPDLPIMANNGAIFSDVAMKPKLGYGMTFGHLECQSTRKNNWEKLKDARAPAVYSGAAVAAAGAVYVFGGQTPHSLTDERVRTACLYRLTDQWALLEAAGPCVRMGHLLAPLESGFLLFGGMTAKRELQKAWDQDFYLDDLWLFRDGVWREVKTEGAKPAARSNCGFCVGDGRLYLWGGYGCFEDGSVWSLDLSTVNSSSRWEEITPVNPIKRRLNHSMFYFAGSVYIWGGEDKLRLCPNDLWGLNLTTHIWARVVDSNAPSSRRCHRAVRVNDSLLVLGGLSLCKKPLREVYGLCLRTWRWTPLLRLALPTPLFDFQVADSETEKVRTIYLVSGRTSLEGLPTRSSYRVQLARGSHRVDDALITAPLRRLLNQADAQSRHQEELQALKAALEKQKSRATAAEERVDQLLSEKCALEAETESAAGEIERLKLQLRDQQEDSAQEATRQSAEIYTLADALATSREVGAHTSVQSEALERMVEKLTAREQEAKLQMARLRDELESSRINNRATAAQAATLTDAATERERHLRRRLEELEEEVLSLHQAERPAEVEREQPVGVSRLTSLLVASQEEVDDMHQEVTVLRKQCSTLRETVTRAERQLREEQSLRLEAEELCEEWRSQRNW
ncbi:MAG: uncharacterized protein KVP18_001067 [Porospora cf. gigantea A]|uniref:uncharacterized protein n=2 Tax=Porospora cf. gigantea A TaxID=2853593 RepID=UPI00355956FE|nr:MAG: hypothetical protein KVP18_001067 [Porospora cf. gigantea A]